MLPAEIHELYAYNRWANQRLLDSSASLSSEQLLKDRGVSFGSIFETLKHIAWGEWLWLARWREQPAGGSNPLGYPSLTTLRDRWSEIERAQQVFIANLAAADLERLVSYENPPGTHWTYSLQHMLQHVVNHSTYHRGQVAGMLRQVGAIPPATDLLVYMDAMAVPPRIRGEAHVVERLPR
ncbi:MAG: DinB family protein [Gemmatimonadaceae bacterium]